MNLGKLITFFFTLTIASQDLIPLSYGDGHFVWRYYVA